MRPEIGLPGRRAEALSHTGQDKPPAIVVGFGTAGQFNRGEANSRGYVQNDPARRQRRALNTLSNPLCNTHDPLHKAVSWQAVIMASVCILVKKPKKP